MAGTIDPRGNDTDADGDPLTVTAVTQGTNGTVTFTPTGVTYTPAANFSGSDSFTYTVSDGNGGSATATVSVTVTPVNNAPTASSVLAVSGPADGTAQLYTPDAAGLYGTTPATVSGLSGFGGTVRTATADVDGDGTNDTVLVTGPGGPVRVTVVSGVDNATVLVAAFDPFQDPNFTGGGFAAAADIDGDGKAEFVVTPDEGGGPRVSVFTRNADATTTRLVNFLGIDDPNFRGGARAALGDVNADGTPDLIVCAGFLGGPRTAVFDGTTLSGAPTRLVNDFFAFPGADATTLRNGVFVAAGDVDGDGFADLIFGGGPGGAPRVFILSGALVSAGNVAGAQATPVANFFVANNSTDRGGVRLAAKDADGDNKADVAAGSGEGSPAKVRVYLGTNFVGSGEPATFQDLSVFGGGALAGGVFVG
ncbi:Ig-like domain-containing protein [Urbifossiella limnaea]|uniref:FG-GAP repeat protein n=1 Tax=Urbifossiella limnaea TaxID=2528023 RepID=A0A517XQ66_9BACT|nr:cadherin-like domain-containing protein [Urbifossiella limnaea]QDU19644.1 FG-GAP repeat protein [Urbifossiella limnaea]